MGYDILIFRTKNKEIEMVEKTDFYEVRGELVPDYTMDVSKTAKEVLYMHKAYWLGNAIRDCGVETKHFIYLTKDNLEDILKRSKQCLENKGRYYYIKNNFNIDYLSIYEEQVIYGQMSYFNRVVSNLLRNKKDVHYWYLKP